MNGFVTSADPVAASFTLVAFCCRHQRKQELGFLLNNISRMPAIVGYKLGMFGGGLATVWCDLYACGCGRLCWVEMSGVWLETVELETVRCVNCWRCFQEKKSPRIFSMAMTVFKVWSCTQQGCRATAKGGKVGNQESPLPVLELVMRSTHFSQCPHSPPAKRGVKRRRRGSQYVGLI